MSQAQITALNILAMSASELRAAVYEKAERNPALVITDDTFQAGEKNVHAETYSMFSDNTRYKKASSSQRQASDNFQSALENNADYRETLTDHLEHQLNAMKLQKEEDYLCRRLIYNLDKNGFNLLAPESLVDKKALSKFQSIEFVEKCKKIIQKLDPVGTCTNNYEESLIVQAELREDVTDCSLFLLHHFDFLDPPQIPKIKRKIEQYKEERLNLKFNTEMLDFSCSEKDIEDSLRFIHGLDPFPAHNFGTENASYVIPDVRIEEVSFPSEDNKDITETKLEVTLAKESRPAVAIAKDYESLAENIKVQDGDTSEKAERQRAELNFARSSITDAKAFIENVLYRESTLLKSCRVIAEVQRKFFLSGPKFLVPLKQKEVAQKTGVHETTISRMASSKFIECKWGIFPISYFFTNAAAKSEKEDSKETASREAVKAVIAELLEAHKNDKKALSDQKICDLLKEKGISIARRTVAKYRSELNISSSFER